MFVDDEFRVDLPIKLLKINVDGYEDRVLAGAERLLKRRCIDFVVMKLLEEVGPSRWQEALQEVRPETLHQIKKVIEFGYAICALTNEGVLVEQRDLFAAVRTRRSNVVLAAREQYQAASLQLSRQRRPQCPRTGVPILLPDTQLGSGLSKRAQRSVLY